MNLIREFKSKIGSKLDLRAVSDRYGDDCMVTDSGGGYHLTMAGRLFRLAGHQNQSAPADLTVIMPHNRIVVGGVNYWPFEGLWKDGGGATPAWQDVAKKIGRRAFGERMDQVKFGVVPGTVSYDADGKATFIIDTYDPKFVGLYAAADMAGFAGKVNCNMFRRRDNVDMVMIPITVASQMITSR